MCYHDLYVYLGCGHAIPGVKPIENAPPCPAATRELFRRPSLASPISPSAPLDATGVAAPWSDRRERNHARSSSRIVLGKCHEKLAHPLHTFRINQMCVGCTAEREQRLARFEVDSISAGVERDFARKRQEEHERMKQSLKMMRAAQVASKQAADFMASRRTDETYMESLGKLMEGVKERMLAWDQSLSPVERRESWVGDDIVGGRH